MKKKIPKRGEVFWVNLNPTLGSEINKIRPALIISNDIGNEISQRIIVAPITSSIKYLYPFEVKIIIEDREGKVLLDQLRCIDKKRLGKKISYYSNDDFMEEVDRALKLVLALK
jgi:mRNA interferase MazF